MPDAKTIEAATECVKAVRSLCVALGPRWTCVLGIVVFGGLYALMYLRTRRLEKGWKEALATKDQMIDQINEQNRELRVQALVVGGNFTKEEASLLVYQENRFANGNGSGQGGSST